MGLYCAPVKMGNIRVEFNIRREIKLYEYVELAVKNVFNSNRPCFFLTVLGYVMAMCVMISNLDFEKNICKRENSVL